MITTYTVQENEQLDDIAKKLNIDKQNIINVNDFVNQTLFPGQIINIPSKVDINFDYYKIKKGDTLYDIATRNNTTVEILSQINGINSYEYLYEGEILLIPKEGIGLYITKTGDTLENVAEESNVSVDSLIDINSNIYLLPEQLILYKK